MRIGIDARPLNVSSGGIRRYAEELIGGLTRLDAGHDYVLYQFSGRSPASTGFPDLDWDPIRFPGKRFLDTLHLVGARGKIDLYHGTNYTVPLWTRIPTVLTVHDLTVQLAPETHPRARRLRHRFLPAACRRATRVIADSRQTRDDLVRLFRLDERKIDVIHLGVSRHFHPVTDPAELARIRDIYHLPDRFALYLGALEPRKNLEALIDAFALLGHEGTSQTLVLAGSGTDIYEAELVAHVRRAGMSPGRDVIFPGHIEDVDLAGLYSACEVFVFPSRYEGFGLPPLEAMACGAPVVLARNSSLVEIYEENCTMFDGTGSIAIAKAVRSTLENEPQRMDRVRRGLRFARARGWDSVCAETLAVYERAILEADLPGRPTRVR